MSKRHIIYEINTDNDKFEGYFPLKTREKKENITKKVDKKYVTPKDDVIDVVLDRDVLVQLGYSLIKINSTIVKITKNGAIINSLSIPSTYNYDNSQYKITKIDDEIFENCDVLEEITIPDSVNKIGRRAFFGCQNLHNVNIPNSLTEIEDQAFLGCENLSEFRLNENVKLGKDVFDKHCKIILP